MARIVNKLDLNKTPQNCENYSLVFAQNVKLGKDNVLCKDDGILPLVLNENIDGDIVGIIPFNNGFFILTTNSKIYQYKEYQSSNILVAIDSAWHYSGGTIDGNVVQTLNGDTILSIAESFDDVENNPLIPLKFININKCSSSDNESIYSQLPEVPFINLELKGKYPNPIPNGVYQFFIRYEIYKDCYTEWFPASKECFAGNPQIIDKTQLGTVKYIDTSYQASESFVFGVNSVYLPNTLQYKKFQIGFILSNDDKIVARSWKLFDINTTTIYFDYDKEYIEEIDIEDVTRPAFDLYNVKNITMFKNKQYISNFVETDYNPNLVDIAKKVQVELGVKPAEDDSDNRYRIVTKTDDDYLLDNIDYNVAVATSDEWEPGVEPLNNEGFISDYVTKLFNEEYSTLKKIILKDLPNVGDKSYIHNVSDYGLYFLVQCNENNTKRYNTLDEVENDQLYGDILTSIRTRNSVESPSDCKHILLENPLYVPNVPYDDGGGEPDVPNYNGVRQEQYAFGVIDFNATLDKDDLESVIEYDSEHDRSVVTRLGIADVVHRVTSYAAKKDKLYYSAFNKDISVSRYVPTTITNNMIKPFEEQVYHSIVYTNDKIVCKTFKVNILQTFSYLFNSDRFVDYTTLIPNQEYKFYIHFVKANGETTNGYLINNGQSVVYESNTRGYEGLIYPKFVFNPTDFTDDVKLQLKDYVAYFISIQHYKNNVLQLIGTAGPKYCLDLDSKLYYSDIIYAKYKDSDGVVKDVSLHYRNSGDNKSVVVSNELKYPFFGNTGLIDSWELNDGGDLSKLQFFYLPYENDSDDVQLIKATPYYPLLFVNVDEYSNLNLGGYICDVYRIELPDGVTQTLDGQDLFYSADNIYEKRIETEVNILKFVQLPYSDENVSNHIAFDIHHTENSTVIYSNFNLNYIGLSESGLSMIVPQVKSAEIKNGRNTEQRLIPWYSFDSLQLSNFYHLPQMYKDYTRKTYSKYTDEAIIKFDNTIRCSELVGDEEKLYRYSFDINDYYHLTPNKGKIVNLFAVGIALVAHTEDSMFKFNGSASFNNEQGGSVQTAESDLFVVGASEIFGSQYGYGGLQNKKNSLITEAGYLFYDNHSNNIYIFNGESNLKVLTDYIIKLAEHNKILDIDFASDLKNDRVFINISCKTQNNENKYITLSYNFASRNFISTHTFDYDYTFNTKVNCYFVKGNNIYHISKTSVGYNALTSNASIFFIDEAVNNNYMSIIDVIYNQNYEIPKILNAISWTCEEINNAQSIFKNARATIETKDLKYKGNKLRVYSDSADTENIDISDTEINNINKFTLPHYERGVWILNYFRNILNLFNTPDLPDKVKNDKYVSDETTLIYGKYFVVRFMFNADKNFKLENVSFNISQEQ